jgi:hypothetical protein
VNSRFLAALPARERFRSSPCHAEALSGKLVGESGTIGRKSDMEAFLSPFQQIIG